MASCPSDFQEAAVTDGDGDEVQVTITGLLRPGEARRLHDARRPTRPTASNGCAIPSGWPPWSIRRWRRSRPSMSTCPPARPAQLPQGGETVVEFPNNHLGYAYTWYGFAIVAVVMLGFWLCAAARGRQRLTPSKTCGSPAVSLGCNNSKRAFSPNAVCLNARPGAGARLL